MNVRSAEDEWEIKKSRYRNSKRDKKIRLDAEKTLRMYSGQRRKSGRVTP